MKKHEIERLDRALHEFIGGFVDGLGRRERREALQWYVTGLLLDGDRKSIYPMAERLASDPGDVESMRQRMQQAICVANWSDEKVLGLLAKKIDRELPGVEAFVIDDTGFPKKGIHSVGVARQYSGTMGRVENCQVAVSLHLASERSSVCAAMRLYLPKEWADDRVRCEAVGVPGEIEFKPKWQIALEQIDAAINSGVRKHVVLADSGYGDCTEFRDELTERGLSFVLGVSCTPIVWRFESKPQRLKQVKKSKTPYTYQDAAFPPIALKDLSKHLEFKTVGWRDGSRGPQTSQFAATRIRTAHRHLIGRPPGEEMWLLCEWPRNEAEPTKFWFSTLPSSASIKTLVRFAKLRWRVERDYQEMKQEVGLDHFEGRKWRGFHHHVTMCAIAHAFLALQRVLFPPGNSKLDPTISQEASSVCHS